MDLQKGDTVKVVDKGAACFGETGTVRVVEEVTRKRNGEVVYTMTHYDVQFPGRGDGPIHYHREQLAKIEEPKVE